MTIDIRENDATDGDAYSVGQNMAFYLDQVADPTCDASTRFEPLVRPCARGEFERSEGRDSKTGSRDVRLKATCGYQSSRLGEQLDQYNRRHHRIAGKMTLEVPVLRSGDSQTARRLSRDEIRDLLDEPHRRLVWQQLDSGGT